MLNYVAREMAPTASKARFLPRATCAFIFFVICLISAARGLQRRHGSLRHERANTPEVTLVTYASNLSDSRVQIMLRSARDHGWTSFSLHENTTFVAPSDPKMDDRWLVRMKAYKNVVDAAHSKSQLFLLVDAFDVLLLGSPKDLVDSYTSNFGMGSVVYQCCKYQWPLACPAWNATELRERTSWKGAWGDSSSSNCFWANAGVFMGTAENLQALFSSFPFDHKAPDPLLNDQCWTNQLFATGRHSFLKLDSKRSLFYGTVWDESNNCNLQVDSGERLITSDLGAHPVVFHLDGDHPTPLTMESFYNMRKGPIGSPLCQQLPRGQFDPNATTWKLFELQDPRCECEVIGYLKKEPDDGKPRCIFVNVGAGNGTRYQSFLQPGSHYGTANFVASECEAYLIEANPLFDQPLKALEKREKTVHAMTSTAAFICDAAMTFYSTTAHRHLPFLNETFSEYDAVVSGHVAITVPTINLLRLLVEQTSKADHVIVSLDIGRAQDSIIECLSHSKAAALVDELFMPNVDDCEDPDVVFGLQSLQQRGVNVRSLPSLK